MQKLIKPVFYLLLFTGIILFIILLMQPLTIFKFYNDLMSSFLKESLALKNAISFLIVQVLMLFVIIPVYILTFVFSWKYKTVNNLKESMIPIW